MCNQMGCGTSSESVHTGNVSPQPSDYYIERASGVSRANMVISQFLYNQISKWLIYKKCIYFA